MITSGGSTFAIALLAASCFQLSLGIAQTDQGIGYGSIRMKNTRCTGHYGERVFENDLETSCQKLCQTEAACKTCSVHDETNECFLFPEDAVCFPAPGWNSFRNDYTTTTVMEGRVAQLACPHGMSVASVKASFGQPSCGMQDASDIVGDLCLSQQHCMVSVASELFPLAPSCPQRRRLTASITCEADVAFFEDRFFTEWSRQHWGISPEVIASKQAEWKQALADIPMYPEGQFSGNGVVIVAGGKYLESAMVTIQLLRNMGSKIRIQVWHLGSDEMPDPDRKLLLDLGVEIRDFEDHVPPSMLKPIQTKGGLRLFQLKPLAIMYSDLENVLLIDSDNTPVMDPAYLFDTEEYKSTGSLFWPDYWKTSTESPIWAIFGLDPSDDWEQESGQLLINKRKAWSALQLTVFLNDEFYMQFLNGDKDTFRFAWLASQTPFAMNTFTPSAIGSLKEHFNNAERGFCSHTMLQHDFEGRPLFLHHNQLKSSQLPAGENFPYYKSLTPGLTRVVPVAGLTIRGQTLACVDISSVVEAGVRMNSDVQEQTEAAQPTALGDFEVEFLAAANSVRAARIVAGSLEGDSQYVLTPNDLSRSRRATSDNVTANCDVGQFEVAPSMCEFIASCSSDQVEAAGPSASEDRACIAGSSYTDPLLKTITVTSDGVNFELAANGDAAVPAPQLIVSQGGRYLFQLSNVPTTSSFAIEDASSVLVAGPVTEDQSAAFEPSQDGDVFDYGDATGPLNGYVINVDDSTSYTLQHSGYRGDHPGPYKRYNTAFDPGNILFTVDVYSLTDKGFGAARTECEVACTEDPECTGFIVFVADTATMCHGLSYLGEPMETLTDSECYMKTTTIQVISE